MSSPSVGDLLKRRGRSKWTSLAVALAPPVADPLAGVEYTGLVDADSAAELSALQVAFRDRREREDTRKADVTDSEFWFAVCFSSRAEKDKFLRLASLAQLGDKYLDGGKVASILNIKE